MDAKTFGHRFESWEKLVHPDDLVGIQKIIEKQLKSGKLIIREVIGEEGYAVERPKFEEALTGKVVIREDAFTREDGRHFWYIVNLIPHFDDGEVKGVFALVTEIKERKELENRLREAKEKAEAANQTKSIFLANMSHALRTPLNAILGFSSMLGHDAVVTPEQREKLAVINRSSELLLSMINDILDLSKIEVGHIEVEEHPFDLAALLEEIGAMIRSRAGEKGLAFTLQTEAISLPYLYADSGQDSPDSHQPAGQRG